MPTNEPRNFDLNIEKILQGWEVKHAIREVRIPYKGSRFNPPSRLPYRLPSFPPELVKHVGTRMTRIGAHIPGAWAY